MINIVTPTKCVSVIQALKTHPLQLTEMAPYVNVASQYVPNELTIIPGPLCIPSTHMPRYLSCLHVHVCIYIQKLKFKKQNDQKKAA